MNFLIEIGQGEIYFSEKINEYIKENAEFIAEICALLRKNTKRRLPLHIDYLNTEDQARENLKAIMTKEGISKVIRQLPSSAGRIYIESVTEATDSYIVTDEYLYTAPEYEHKKENTDFISFTEWKEAQLT